MNAVSETCPRWEPFVVLLALLAAPSLLAAQTPPPRDPARPVVQPTIRDRLAPRTTGTGALRGRVVDGETGKPIARARVRLMSGGPNNSVPVLTDSDGAFTLTGLPPGYVSMNVEKPTYLPGRYPDTPRTLRGRATPTGIANGQVLDVTVKMFHGGAITGRVVDAYGDPVDFAQVQVLFVPRGRPPQARGGSSTNDLGEFRIARLEPGRYILSVTPRNMNMEEPAPGVAPMPQPQPTPTYYPGASSAEQAQAIVINRGETVSGIEVMLGEGLPTILTGTVSGPEGPMQKSGGTVMARLASVGQNYGPAAATAPIRPDGTFRMSLTPGQYIVEARVYPQPTPGEVYQQGRELSGMVQANVGAGQTEFVAIVIGKGATASGRFVFEGTSPVPAAPVGRGMRPPIMSEGPSGCRTGEATFAADWTFKIDGLFGMCSPASGAYGRWGVKSVRIGGVNVLEKPITFEPNRHYDNVEIVVTDRPAVVELRVVGEDGQLTREFVALAFPVDKATWKQSQRVVRPVIPRVGVTPGVPIPPANVLSPLGQNRDAIAGLLPGEYHVITLDDIDAEDAYDPAVLEKLAQYATRVSVAHEGAIELTLNRLKIADIIR
jgi:hypothetical protein